MVFVVPLPTWMAIEPESISLALAIPARVPVDFAVSAACRAGVIQALCGRNEFELTLTFPSAPEVFETRLNRDPEASVSTLAVMPTAGSVDRPRQSSQRIVRRVQA